MAMTDDEKKRLADILENIDELDEGLVEDTSTSAVAVRPGEKSTHCHVDLSN